MTIATNKTMMSAAAGLLTLGLSAGVFCSATAAEPVGGGLVDLTYAAEKAVPAVVHIKYVQNSKVTTMEVEDPFSDFFSEASILARTPSTSAMRSFGGMSTAPLGSSPGA